MSTHNATQAPIVNNYVLDKTFDTLCSILMSNNKSKIICNSVLSTLLNSPVLANQGYGDCELIKDKIKLQTKKKINLNKLGNTNGFVKLILINILTNTNLRNYIDLNSICITKTKGKEIIIGKDAYGQDIKRNAIAIHYGFIKMQNIQSSDITNIIDTFVKKHHQTRTTTITCADPIRLLSFLDPMNKYKYSHNLFENAVTSYIDDNGSNICITSTQQKYKLKLHIGTEKLHAIIKEQIDSVNNSLSTVPTEQLEYIETLPKSKDIITFVANEEEQNVMQIQLIYKGISRHGKCQVLFV